MARWLRRLAYWIDLPPMYERVPLGGKTTTTGDTTSKLTTWTWAGGDSMGGHDG